MAGTEAVRVGFVGFGEVNTPKEVIRRKCDEARRRLEALGFTLVATDPVSDDPQGRDAARAVSDLKRGDFDLLVLCVAGWIPSWAVVRITSEFAHKPMLLWGLTGWLENGRLVTTADQAGTSALRKVLADLGYSMKYVYERFGAAPRDAEILAFGRAARAAAALNGAKIGMMGYRDMNLYGTMFDGTSLRRTVGVEIEFFEMLEMAQRIEKLNPKEVAATIAGLKKAWEFEKPAQEQTLRTGVSWYLAVRDKVRERGYQAVSLIDVDGMKKLLGFPPAMVFMLLAEQLEVATVPENDSLGAVTQLIFRHLTGQIAPYLEFYEFFEDRLLMGVPDFVPPQVVEGRVKVTPTAFGQLGEGLLNISKVNTGRVTLARLTTVGERYALHVVGGEAHPPRSWEECGWKPPAPQLPSLEVAPDCPVEEFAQKVLSQHYILAYGDHAEALRDFCRIRGIDWY